MSFDIIKDILVFSCVYLPPLVLLWRFWSERGRNTFVFIFIALLYIGGSLYTQNLFPFILVLLNIWYLKKAGTFCLYFEEYKDNHMETQGKVVYSERIRDDYCKFKFSLRGFKPFKALKYSLISYVVTILISSIVLLVFSKYNINVKDQDVVTWMTNLPLKKFLLTMPIAVIFAPVVEEFVFRWMFFEKIFKKRMGLFLGALLSSLIFAIIHYNLKAFPLLLWIGIYNCYLIHKKGYWYSVFNHMFFNLVTTTILLLSKLQIIKI